MINALKVTTPKGESLTIDLRSPEKSGFFIKNIDGLGPSKAIINMGESLYEDGATFNSTRVSNKNIVLELGFYDNGSESIEQIRRKTYRFFPMKTPIQIEVETDSRHGVITGYVESNEPNIFSKEEGTSISIICPSAYFLGEDYILTTFSGVSGGFEFPFENASTEVPTIDFGDVFINSSANVFYTGDVPTGVRIFVTFLGAVTDLTISNVITGEDMAISSAKVAALTGENFKAGDILYIVTEKGRKGVALIRSGNYYNILNAVDILADWFQIQPGDNVFTYTAVAGLANMQFGIDHRVVYEGL